MPLTIRNDAPRAYDDLQRCLQDFPSCCLHSARECGREHDGLSFRSNVLYNSHDLRLESHI